MSLPNTKRQDILDVYLSIGFATNLVETHRRKQG